MENIHIPVVSESAAKVLAATSISQSLSFCMERKYLEKIADTNLNPYFELKEVGLTSKNDVSWIESLWIKSRRIVLQPCKKFSILVSCLKKLNCFF